METTRTPVAATLPVPRIRRYQEWLQARHGLAFQDYDALWRWSTTELEAFWHSVWEYFAIQSPTPYTAVLERNVMPGARWFPGAQVNYARQVLRHVEAAHAAGQPALIACNERGQRRDISWPELRRQCAALALHLRAQGVQPGDRVAAYLPNIPETIVALLACASIGAVWSVCAPDMGTAAVLDRFRQITPKVLIAIDGVTYGGREHDRGAVLQELRAQLPSVQHVVLVNGLEAPRAAPDCQPWAAAVARDDAEVAAFEPLWLAFDHPLWIVYSSGTTGLPKPIVHGHGGMLLVKLQQATLHCDIGCSYAPETLGERFHWYSSTGWVMWNAQVGGLLGGTTCVLYDGHPGGSRDNPDWSVLWRMAAETGVTFFGAGAAFYGSCMKAGLQPTQCGDLSAIRALGSTGSPLSAEVQQWGTDFFRQAHAAAPGHPGADIWWCNISGGTDFAGSFLGGNRELPQHLGRLQCRMLGAAVQAWDDAARPVLDAVGELVCTQPIPSMPLYLWGDADGARLHASYFAMYPPGHGRRPGGGDLGPEAGSVWRHGDWIEIGSAAHPGCVIYGRSDATINRHGLRMGTSEVYAAVEALPEVLDSLVVDLEYLGRDSFMPLFVVLRSGAVLDEPLRERVRGAIRAALSPRFVPDEIVQVAEVPRTLSGKKQELPIKKLLLGQPLAQVVNRDAMANPDCLGWYVAYAEQRGHVAGS
ncbi:acetoacetyl-CoA synthetase [Oryzisolibacter propanilivorax]|uniref:Acetoacetyl-CoA synthetase n=1 Tax=Oryzisolibacter propanilivorax TaxID=1527607 RepID=A0A1G9Q3L6_9BURK|nr:acetoacetate--CoA ligase [Oryzisolibacter propanilivorax]SDM05503.1 acetoacetyl-CoA synthetase [Oryzisolibacter propanilivorax]